VPRYRRRQLQVFGTNGWEITFGNRPSSSTHGLPVRVGFLQNKLKMDAPLPTDTTLIDQHVNKADQILIGHGHWDHMADVPYIAKKTGAMVIGSESHANSCGRPRRGSQDRAGQGREYMQFDGYTIEVFPSVHSMGGTKKYGPGHVSPCRLRLHEARELPEGDLSSTC